MSLIIEGKGARKPQQQSCQEIDSVDERVSSILRKAKYKASLNIRSQGLYSSIDANADTDTESDESDLEIENIPPPSRWNTLYGNRSQHLSPEFGTTVNILQQPISPGSNSDSETIAVTLTPSPNFYRPRKLSSGKKAQRENDPIVEWSSRIRDVSRKAVKNALFGIGIKSPQPSLSPSERDSVSNESWETDQLLVSAKQLVRECTRRDQDINIEAEKIKYDAKIANPRRPANHRGKRTTKGYDPRLVMEERHKAIRLRREKRKEERKRLLEKKENINPAINVPSHTLTRSRERRKENARMTSSMKPPSSKNRRTPNSFASSKSSSPTPSASNTCEDTSSNIQSVQCLLKRCLRKWKCHLESKKKQKKKQRMAMEFQVRSSHRRKKSFFTKWKTIYENARQSRIQMQYIVEKKLDTLYQCRLLRKTFRSFQQLFETLQERKERAFNFRKWRLQTYVFDQLRCHASAMKLERQKAIYLIHQQRKREKEQKACKFYMMKQKSKSFLAWRWTVRRLCEAKAVQTQHAERKRKIEMILSRMEKSPRSTIESNNDLVKENNKSDKNHVSNDKVKETDNSTQNGKSTTSGPSFLQKMEKRAAARRQRRKLIKERNEDRVKNMKIEREQMRLLKEMEEERAHLELIAQKRKDNLDKRREKALMKKKAEEMKRMRALQRKTAIEHRQVALLRYYGWNRWRRIISIKNDHRVKSENHYRLSLMEGVWRKLKDLYVKRKNRERKRLSHLECLAKGFLHRHLRRKVFMILKKHYLYTKKRVAMVIRSRNLDTKQKFLNHWSAMTSLVISDQRQKMAIADRHSRPVIFRRIMLRLAKNVVMSRQRRAQELRRDALRNRAFRYLELK